MSHHSGPWRGSGRTLCALLNAAQDAAFGGKQVAYLFHKHVDVDYGLSLVRNHDAFVPVREHVSSRTRTSYTFTSNGVLWLVSRCCVEHFMRGRRDTLVVTDHAAYRDRPRRVMASNPADNK